MKSGFVIDGIKGFHVSLSAGACQGSIDNSKIQAEVPVSVDFSAPPAVTGGLPMNLKVTYTFIVETALTGKNSTLVGAGKYKLTGPFRTPRSVHGRRRRRHARARGRRARA